MYVLLLISAFLISAFETAQISPQPAVKIYFPSSDALIVTADLFFVSDSLPYMILCHQAGYSRAEYAETARKFCMLGFNSIAIDQRSGKEVNGVINETAALATLKKKPTAYLDAEKDIVAAIDYAYAKSGKKIVVVGSSYSASLALKIGATNKKVKAVISFSPGEYFGTKLNLKESIKNLTIPVFATSSKEEAAVVTELMKGVPSKSKQQFIPNSKGKHGSSCLWKENPGYHEYWLALMMFVKQLQ